MNLPQFTQAKQDPLENIAYLSNQIAQESIMVAKPAKQMIARLHGLMDETLAFVDDRVKLITKSFNVNQKDIDGRLLAEIDHVVIIGEAVPVPKGLNVSYLEYIDTLEDSASVANRLQNEVLRPFSTYLGTLLTYPAKFNDRSLSADVRVVDVANHEKVLASCLSGNHTQRSVGKLVRRSKDWALIDSKLNVLTEAYMAQRPEVIAKLIDDIDEVMEALFAKLSESTTTVAVSNTTVKHIATLANQVAQMTNFYANYCAQLWTLVNSYREAKQHVSQFM